MDTLTTEAEIAELQKVRRQTGWWRMGAGAVTALWVAGCFFTVNDSVQGLFKPGERQTKFVSTLSTNVQNDVAPGVQSLVAQTIAETRPEVEASFMKLNDRVPELTQASMTELETLQTSLPQKGEKILGETYGTMLAEKETKLRAMFPEATEENIKTLTKNLSDVAQTKAVSVNDKLFGRHQTALNGIVTHMEQIRLEEAGVPASPLGTNWEMALAIMDVVREDMRELETLAAKNQKQVALKNAASAALPGPKTATEK
jgi:Asp-tRNA(Asn)/Glu-tRNA(Gln) amidotransferase C subunit